MPGKIVYDGKSLSLPVIGNLKVALRQEGKVNFSASRKHEAINFASWQEISLQCQAWTREEAFSLYAFWSWARLGNSFSLAISENESSSTTLDGAANAGQKVVPLTATTGFSVGDYCLIEQAAGDEFEIIKIASISAGVSITAESDLIYSYASGDSFRHAWYWSSVILSDESLDVLSSDTPAMYTDISLRFEEVS